jgi:DNA-binding transcriptional ArsR family regulator
MSEPAPAGLDGTLAALADPVRRRAVELLAERPRRAGELAKELGTAPSTMSKHLRVLRQCGLVTETSPDFDTRVRIYALTSAPMADLRRWLAAAEQAWADQLASFAAHLERGANVDGPGS